KPRARAAGTDGRQGRCSAGSEHISLRSIFHRPDQVLLSRARCTRAFDERKLAMASAPTLAPVAPARDAVPAQAKKEPEVNKLFRMVMKYEGSDLHLKVGLPPMMRLAGTIRAMELPPLSATDMERLLLALLSERQAKILEETGGIDFAHIIGDDECRFRVNLFRQRGRLSLVAR